MNDITERSRFHLAIPVNDMQAARSFYTQILECSVGRESDRWIDFNFHGHQLTAHLVDHSKDAPCMQKQPCNRVDGKDIPVRHFGLILCWGDWHNLKDRLKSADTEFLVDPGIRFEGLAGEQATLFIQDPAGNGIEFKAFRDATKLFERQIT